jgi:hypothetical protein
VECKTDQEISSGGYTDGRLFHLRVKTNGLTPLELFLVLGKSLVWKFRRKNYGKCGVALEDLHLWTSRTLLA